MRIGPLWGKSSHKLTLLFLIVLVPPAVILVWLGLRLLEEDRKDGLARELERRTAVSDAIIRSLDQSLDEAEHWLTGGQIPDGVLGLTMSVSGVAARPAGRALWLPASPPMQEGATGPFAEAEKAEHQVTGGDHGLARYDELARSAEPATRAGALLRVARVHLKAGRTDAALRAYQTLAAIHQIAIVGTPADFIARRAICELLQGVGRPEALGREAAALRTDFLANRWVLDWPTWHIAADEIARWTGKPLIVAVDRRVLSAAAGWLWDAWRRTEGARLLPSGQGVIFVEGAPVTVMWRTAGSRLEAVAMSSEVVATWMQNATQGKLLSMERVSLLTESDELIAGEKPDRGSGMVLRSGAETGLPWTLALSAGDLSRDPPERAARRRLLSFGLAAIVLFLSGGSYFLWRVVSRELAVARLQTDFVAAVSHEFRTPLTSLRHITELLDEDDELPVLRRKSFYSVLGRNTDRLHRLVESLLDFARMENDKKPWDMRSIDMGELAAAVVADFRSQALTHPVTIDLDVADASPLRVHADAGALTHAVWNLLDNAVKYSPEERPVRLSVHPHSSGVAISVRDEGVGIPRHERKDIFRKFVRGVKARELGIKGTGLGLAMVSHIVKAHGGAIELETEEGRGSTFRLVLPARA